MHSPKATPMPSPALTQSSSARDWWIVLSALGLGLLLTFAFRGKPPYRPGVVRELSITVVPEDRHRLKCLEEHQVGGLSCEERSATRLAPYVTTNRELVLLSGVFSHTAVQEEERRRRGRHGSARRFTINCQVELIDYTQTHRAQFGPRARIENVSAWIARTRDCTPVN